MNGTLINAAAVIAGSILGLIFGSRLPDRIRQTLVAGLGLFTGIIGIKLFGSSENVLIVLGSLLLGGIVGELLGIQDKLTNLGGWIEGKIAGVSKKDTDSNEHTSDSKNRFIKGFLTASLLYCIGPMAILGSIQDGLNGDSSLLIIKSTLDGFASLAFASSLGIGVLFSVIPMIVYQGTISLAASFFSTIMSTGMQNEMTAVGGVLLVGLAISSLLEIKPIRIGSFLPSLIIAPLIVWLLSLFAL